MFQMSERLVLIDEGHFFPLAVPTVESFQDEGGALLAPPDFMMKLTLVFMGFLDGRSNGIDGLSIFRGHGGEGVSTVQVRQNNFGASHPGNPAASPVLQSADPSPGAYFPGV